MQSIVVEFILTHVDQLFGGAALSGQCPSHPSQHHSLSLPRVTSELESYPTLVGSEWEDAVRRWVPEALFLFRAGPSLFFPR